MISLNVNVFYNFPKVEINFVHHSRICCFNGIHYLACVGPYNSLGKDENQQTKGSKQTFVHTNKLLQTGTKKALGVAVLTVLLTVMAMTVAIMFITKSP